MPKHCARRSAYGITGVPDVVYSGANIPTSQANIDIVTGIPALAEMTAEWSFTGNYIQCDVEVEALGDLGSNNALHMAMIEKEINHNVQTNGETTFYHVFRKFMDGANGHAMGSMTAGNTYTHYANSTISVNSAPAQGSFDFWVGTSNMDIIVWLQDNTTGEVLQAAYADYTTSSVNEMDNFARYIAVYPNPANDIAGVEIDLDGSRRSCHQCCECNGSNRIHRSTIARRWYSKSQSRNQRFECRFILCKCECKWRKQDLALEHCTLRLKICYFYGGLRSPVFFD